MAEPTRDLAEGWALASDLGRPAVKLLWEMLREEKSNVERRLALLAAAVLAGGPNEDETLFAWLDQQKPMAQERVLAAILLALGPRRQRAMPGFWTKALGPEKTPQELLGIAVRLAAARFPGTEEGAPSLDRDDPGLAAATAYAGLPVPPHVVQKLWNLRTPERHAELFWRGAMLGSARVRTENPNGQDPLLERARDLMTLGGDPLNAARAAAAILRGRAHDVKPDGPRPDWKLLQLVAADPASAQSLSAWLGPAAQPRAPEPPRLAVSYVLSRTPEQVVADRAVWSAEPTIRRHVAIALAMRLLGETSPQPVELRLPEVPEWTFVRWASGASDDTVAGIDDATLQAALELMFARRMPRPVLRSILEETLWRWGSHPGLGMFDHERLLLRDLLLVGSNEGGGKYQSQVHKHERYRPQGLGPDDVLFPIAVALYEFASRPRLPMPPELRLH